MTTCAMMGVVSLLQCLQTFTFAFRTPKLFILAVLVSLVVGNDYSSIPTHMEMEYRGQEAPVSDLLQSIDQSRYRI
jgi:membrane protein required for beta-lactamase induction